MFKVERSLSWLLMFLLVGQEAFIQNVYWPHAPWWTSFVVAPVAVTIANLLARPLARKFARDLNLPPKPYRPSPIPGSIVTFAGDRGVLGGDFVVTRIDVGFDGRTVLLQDAGTFRASRRVS